MRAIDCAPTRDSALGDVASCDVIGMPSEATPGAKKAAAHWPVRLRDEAALGAGLACVGRIHQHKRHPESCGLVSRERDLLGERPGVQGAPRDLEQPYISPARQVDLANPQAVERPQIGNPPLITDTNSSLRGPHGRDANIPAERDHAGIERHRPVRPEEVRSLLGRAPVGTGGDNSGDGLHRRLSTQPREGRPRLVVGQTMQRDGLEGSVRPGRPGDKGGSLVAQRHRCRQPCRILVRRVEPQLDDRRQSYRFCRRPAKSQYDHLPFTTFEHITDCSHEMAESSQHEER